MWRTIVRGNWFRQTRAERAGYRNAINLFFGALLGTNLGSLAGLALGDYVEIIILLAAVVMALQLVSTARSRGYALLTLAIYGGLLAAAFRSGQLQPDGMSDTDFAKLMAMLGVWLGTAAAIEATPVVPPPPEPD